VDEQNWGAEVYNSKLRNLLPTLQGSLHGSKIVYVDAYRALMDIIDHPTKHGMFFDSYHDYE
jgi:phospholipase/lecithinase/hemolysin